MLKPGPILPTQDADAERFVTKSAPSIDKKIVPTAINNIYVKIKLVILIAVSLLISFPFSVTGDIMFGWTLCVIPRLISFKAPKNLTHLIPPPVEEAHPPTNISRRSSILLKDGHRLKSAVAYPVVVMTEDTWNSEWRKDSPILSYTPLKRRFNIIRSEKFRNTRWRNFEQ